mgnify:CR=1 FL=1
MRIWTKRGGSGLIVDDDASAIKLEKVPWDTYLQTDIKQPRNYERLKLRWALIHIVARAVGEDDEDMSDKLKIACGYYRELRFRDGRVDRKALSISYDEMDEITFAQYFEREVQAIYMLYGILPEHVRRELDAILAPRTEKYR